MDSYSLIHDNIQPVILGTSYTARAVARAFYSQYRVVSYLCREKRPFFSFFSISSAFVKLRGCEHDDVNLDILSRLAASDSSCIWLLIVCDDRLSEFVERMRPALESIYIISDAAGLRSSHPLLSELAISYGKAKVRAEEKKDGKNGYGEQNFISGGKINVS